MGKQMSMFQEVDTELAKKLDALVEVGDELDRVKAKYDKAQVEAVMCMKKFSRTAVKHAKRTFRITVNAIKERVKVTT